MFEDNENETPLMQKNDGENKSKMMGYINVATGMCFHLFAGNVYLWSNIAPYIISYFHYLGDKDATLSIGVICMPLTWFS